MQAALLLLPNLLDKTQNISDFLPDSVRENMATIDGLIAESPEKGRSFLKHFQLKKKPHNIPLAVFEGREEDVDFYLEPIRKGERWGFVSDCGLPCIADPGARLVLRAHALGIPVEAFVGPSSIFLALMLSGLPGQNFHFHGYLPKDSDRLLEQIKMMMDASRSQRSTQIFMEAPYRNMQLLEALLEKLEPRFYLSIATDITLPTQEITTKRVKDWRKKPLPELNKRPSIFLFTA